MKKVYFFALLFAPLFLVAQTQKLPPIVEWQKNFGGSRDDRANSVIPTADHGFLIVGFASSNDGDVTDHHGSNDSSDAWVVKLNRSGDVEWKKSYGGTNFDAFKHVIQATNGDFICVGSTRSVDGDVTGLHTSSGVVTDLWAVRINRYGVIQWSKVFGGSAEDNGQVIRRMADGNYLIGGDTQSGDFDVTGNHGASDMWILKINDQGNLLWQKTFGNPNSQFVTSITATSDNNYVISGSQSYMGYPADPRLTPNDSYNTTAIVKIDAQGNTLWESLPLFSSSPLARRSRFYWRVLELPNHELFTIGPNTDFSYPWQEFCRLDNSNGNVLQSSIGALLNMSLYNGNFFRNAGPDMAQILSDSSIITCASLQTDSMNKLASLSRFSTKSNNAGTFDFFYQNQYQGQFFNGVIALQDEEYITAGSILINQRSDFWVVKFNAHNQITGKVFIDNNSNGVKDAGEPYFKKGFVESRKNGKVVSSAIDTSGVFLNPVDTGTYTTIPILGGTPYYTISPASKQSVFTSFNNKDSFSFALVPVGIKNDLQLSLQSITTMRPGFEASYRIDYVNVGTSTIAQTVIKFVKPATTNFVSATLAPSSVTADTITWNTGGLSPFDASYINLVLRSNPPPAVNVGDVLVLSATIDPVAGDVTPADNFDTVYQAVRGSVDPNDKVENSNGSFYVNQLQANEPLTYTIRFQNIGNDTAFNIIVRDTLSDQLDVASLEMISASHPYSFVIKDNKYCTWTFNDILLPDKTSNEPASHGYLTYRIKPKTTLQLGDKIYNSASIYFDFNLPVKTNNQETIIKPSPVPPPPQPVVSGLQLNYCNNLGAQKARILNLPASTSGITITAKLDATLLTIAGDSTVTFTVSALAAGPHNFTVIYSNVTDTKKTTAGFTVAAAATPEVNLSANTTNVVNLANPVIVTAANASGGGKDPRYTFAWNNSFTNIVQTESINNILNVTASSLALGDNKIYVKMKTSEDCYTVQTNIDSITIRRDMSTGITDTDNPGQVIKIYPNPVNGPITIDGLSTGKTYTFKIVNLQGQVMITKRVVNQSTTSISEFKGESGVYWLTIYDEKKNRLLGSVQLIKQ
jgi:uncharacterized repeat protein (TIGR01451 family)